jgi:putative ABC transport system permease protein
VPLLELLRLAIESLRANRMRTGLTMLGLIIGVAAVVLLLALGNGARNAITREFEGMGTNLIIIQPGRTEARRSMGHGMGATREKLTLEDVRALQRQAYSLAAVTGMVFGQVKAKVLDRVVDTQLLGSNEQMLQIFAWKLGHGQFFTEEDDLAGRRVAVLGSQTARSLFGDADPLGKLVKLNESEHRVVGIMRRAGQTFGIDTDDVIFIPNRSAMRILNLDRLFGIRAKARSRGNVEDTVAEITAILTERHAGEEDFTVTTQASMLQSLDSILRMLTWVLGGIAMISMVVGGIGIMNIMLVSVTERTREIGIRRAVGARRRDIQRQFLLEAVLISLTGGLIGLASSWTLSLAVGWILPAFNMKAPGWALWPAFSSAFFVGAAFGVWPARKASRIATIDALRFE